MGHHILIVDDEVNALKVLAAALNNDQRTVDTATCGEEALMKIRQRKYQLVLTDFRMPGINGEKLLEKLLTIHPETKVVLFTAYGTIDLAVNAMRKGAYTYLTKPVDLDRLEEVVAQALGDSPPKSGQQHFFNIIGQSAAMQEVFSLIRRVGKTEANILVLGESGTGKELVARAIHYSSYRSDQPFIPIDCATIPADLMESELFGHERGAFTNAAERKIGLIEMAQRGTVFLDEIGELDIRLQKKLLRFLQEKDILRVGGKSRIPVDARVIAATNREIEDEVERGTFRADLYYRLNVIAIRLPPLRERRQDIPLIAHHYLETFCAKNKKEIRGFDKEVLDILQHYDWPGNVRELENCIERAVILCPLETINRECLPRKLRALDQSAADRSLRWNLPELERKVILRALDKTAWNQSQAAVLLGISRKQLRTKMKNIGLLQK